MLVKIISTPHTLKFMDSFIIAEEVYKIITTKIQIRYLEV